MRVISVLSIAVSLQITTKDQLASCQELVTSWATFTTLQPCCPLKFSNLSTQGVLSFTSTHRIMFATSSLDQLGMSCPCGSSNGMISAEPWMDPAISAGSSSLFQFESGLLVTPKLGSKHVAHLESLMPFQRLQSLKAEQACQSKFSLCKNQRQDLLPPPEQQRIRMPQANALDLVGDQFDLISWGSEVAVQSFPAPPKAMRMRWVQTSSLPTAPCSTTCIIAPNQRAKAIGTASLFTALYSQTSSTAANESFLKYVLLHMPTRWTSLGTSLTSFLGLLKSVLAVLPAAVQSPPAPPKAMRMRWVQTSSLPTAPCSTTCIIAPNQRAKAIGTASLFTALYSQTSSTAANESFFRYVLLHSWHHFQPP